MLDNCIKKKNLEKLGNSESNKTRIEETSLKKQYTRSVKVYDSRIN